MFKNDLLRFDWDMTKSVPPVLWFAAALFFIAAAGGPLFFLLRGDSFTGQLIAGSIVSLISFVGVVFLIRLFRAAE